MIRVFIFVTPQPEAAPARPFAFSDRQFTFGHIGAAFHQSKWRDPMTQIRYSFLQTLAALFRLRREGGTQPEVESIAPHKVVGGVPESLRRDVGLPPVIERPPPIKLSQYF